MADHFDLIVRNAMLVSPSGLRAADIGISGGRFAAIVPRGELSLPADSEIDARGLYALPGVIDGHVHFREPGLEYKEDWLTGTRAAVMGGVTTVLDMPNTIPPTDSVERARTKLALASTKAYCDFGVLGLLGADTSLTAELIGSGLVCGLKVFMGPTTGDLSVPPDLPLAAALASAARAGMRVAFHAEDMATVSQRVEALRALGRTDARAHLESRPVEAEASAIDRAGSFLLAARCRGHILHISSGAGLAAVTSWRARGVDLTTEVTPHHCLLGADVYERPGGGLAKVNPPIRGEPDASALLAALADGRVDVVGSDHAPHAAEEKARSSIWEAESGVCGVELLLRLFLTAVSDGRLSLERLAYATSEGPARAWRLWPGKGAVKVGSDADLTLVDPERRGVIRAKEMHGKNNATPFEGRATRGAAVATIVRGRVVMRDGELLGQPGWGRALAAPPSGP